MKVALVCDWLTNVGGAEKVLLNFHQMFPNAPIYTSQYNPKKIDWFKDADVRTGWMQILPSCLRRFLSPLRQFYFKNLDLSEYDLIISVTGAEAKSVKKGKAYHICYCHVPTQYYWQLYDQYLVNPGFGILNPIVRLFFMLFVHPLRKADFKAAQQPDEFITISTYAQSMIKKYYKREATVIFPPVAVENFYSPDNNIVRQDFITTSRQVSWKRLDLAIKACIKTNWPLTVIGEGPEHKKLVRLAKKSPLITFKPTMNQAELKEELSHSAGYIFPSLEPFGIAPVEALAAGCPVIAFGEGGALDYVIDKENGILFSKQTTNSLVDAIKKFEKSKFSAEKVAQSAIPFDEKVFRKKIKGFLSEKLASQK